MTAVPEIRIRSANDGVVNDQGEYIVYWMIAYRRLHYNYALQRAVEWARKLKKPIIVLEALRTGYRWASHRIHRFVIEGMADNFEHFGRSKKVLYYPYIEPKEGAGKGLLKELSQSAAMVVTDEFPCFMLPRMVKAAAKQVDVLMEVVDSNGLYPLAATDRVFTTAYSFRRYLQKNLPDYLEESPQANCLGSVKIPVLKTLPDTIRKKWPPATTEMLQGGPDFLDTLPIDGSVEPVTYVGGAVTAQEKLDEFIYSGLSLYKEERNYPEAKATSGFSPYLHFGHLSVHQVFEKLTNREHWTMDHIGEETRGKREGWWGMGEDAEAFLDELITWREIGYNMCWHRDDYDQYQSLPDWAKKTLAEHEDDDREYTYTLEQFEMGQTHDTLWNAAQGQLLEEGRIHNYLRMLWGKKIFEWTENPQQALDFMIELNNKYAVDGRNPNSYSGIFWILGRYDRAWGPERPIYGKIRYMTSKSTRRKFPVQEYIHRYAPRHQFDLFEDCEG